MSDKTLVSYAQNDEDVVLWRALGHVSNGRYVDVGACDPVELSVTKALYDRGWRGLDIDAVPGYAARLREARPGNDVLHAAITDQPVDELTFHEIVGTGLSSLVDSAARAAEAEGFERREISVPAISLDDACARASVLGADLHVLKIDVEGAEAEVLRSFDLDRWRPWVVVVEATVPLSTEPAFAEWDPILTEAGYVFTLFDGLSRWYHSPDHPELARALSYPACVLDDFVPIKEHLLTARVDNLTVDLATADREVVRWRGEAVSYWSNAITAMQLSEDAADDARAETQRAKAQLDKLRARLADVRAERQQLRNRVRRLSQRLEATTPAPAAPARRAAHRLRSAVRKIRTS